jgi:hypothetical protein
VAQLGARFHGMEEVVGSIPTRSTKLSRRAVQVAGPGQFTIGIGRMYVDGLLAECHGLSPVIFHPTLGELAAPIPITAQPYYPNPNPGSNSHCARVLKETRIIHRFRRSRSAD